MKEKKANKIEELIANAERYTPDLATGLNNEQVQARIEGGLVNKTIKRVSKSYGRIIFENFISFFNIILYIVAGLMIFAQKFDGILFIPILLLNITIGLIQDIRARRAIDKMRLISDPKATVIRDLQEKTLNSQDLVLDDLYLLKSGNQILVDAIIMHGSISVDESSLTGESVLIKKGVGDTIYSGTYVRSGSAKARVNQLGRSNYIEKIQEKTRNFTRPKTEIFRSITNILKVIAIIVVVVAVLTIILYAVTGRFVDLPSIQDAIGFFAGSIISMIPSGMYLLTSVTLAFGVIKLVKHRTLVQELYSIETLARVNVLCLDKTGTLTDGNLFVEEVINYTKNNMEKMRQIFLSFFRATTDENVTARSIITHYQKEGFDDYLESNEAMPFDSAKKYSMARFTNGNTYVLGAPENILTACKKEYAEALKKQVEGYRVLAFMQLKKDKKEIVPANLECVAILLLGDHIRETARPTLEWFYENDVRSIIISGDGLEYIKSIADKTGLVGYEKGISIEGMADDELRRIARDYIIFARATPEQKEVIIDELQKQGDCVAMIGDGVNDILALKKANCSVAMASGSDAAKNVAHLVLQDSNFDALPNVVAEGRRVINNLQRTCSLFLVKTLFAIVLSIAFLFTGLFSQGNSTYPLVPNNFYVWEMFGIGIAAALLAFEPNYKRIEGKFLPRIFINAVPGALVMLLAVGSILLLNMNSLYPLPELPEVTNTTLTMVTTVMGVVSVLILLRICLPFSKWRAFVFLAITVVVLAIVLVTGLTGVPLFISIFRMDFTLMYGDNWWQYFLQMGIVIVIAGLLLMGLSYLFEYIPKWRAKKNANQ